MINKALIALILVTVSGRTLRGTSVNEDFQRLLARVEQQRLLSMAAATGSRHLQDSCGSWLLFKSCSSDADCCASSGWRCGDGWGGKKCIWMNLSAENLGVSDQVDNFFDTVRYNDVECTPKGRLPCGGFGFGPLGRNETLTMPDGQVMCCKPTVGRGLRSIDARMLRGVSAEVVLEAAKFGVEVTEKAANLIWSVTGMANKPYVHAYTFNNASNEDCRSLQDGDTICIRKLHRTASLSRTKVQMRLITPNSMTWWKALTVHAPENHFLYELLYNQDSVHSNTNLVEYGQLVNNFVVLSKAKAFGVHTNMYWIQNSYDFTPEYDWEIEWKKD